jgi:hypothetical protein
LLSFESLFLFLISEWAESSFKSEC